MTEGVDAAADRAGPAQTTPTARVDWFSAAAVRLHATMIAGVALSTGAAVLEWTRALRGREIAWVYAFEWPLFAVMGVYVWWKLLHGDRPGGRRRGRSAASGRATVELPAGDDPGLAAWQDYLFRLHASDPPGGPPPR